MKSEHLKIKADLHIHTDISDGSYSIEEIVTMAKNNNTTYLAITNHDTTRGLKEAIAIGEKQNIKIIPGIEISAYNFEKNKKVHILGYNFDLQSPNINRLCKPILKRRHENSLWQINQLNKNDYKINIYKIYERAKNSKTIYKQHIMAELNQDEFSSESYIEQYIRLFKGDGICSRDIDYVDAVEAVKAIKSDNGIAVLAHPGQLKSFDILEKLIETGLDGIELYHEDHTKEDFYKIIEYSDRYNLILTGGTDFHGKYGRSINIGDITSPNEYLHFFDRSIKKPTSKIF